MTIIDATNMQRRGVCIEHENDYGGNHTFLFAENPGDRASCFYCVRLFIRTVNILEKIESGCVTLGEKYNLNQLPSLEQICRNLDPNSQIITLFAENYSPINCRSALEGVFHFAYQVRPQNKSSF